MDNKKTPPTPLHAQEICFGLNRATDKRSLAAFLQRFAEPAFLQTLIPRLKEEEITSLLDFLSSLMHKHCSEKEYHRLFLKD